MFMSVAEQEIPFIVKNIYSAENFNMGEKFRNFSFREGEQKFSSEREMRSLKLLVS